MILKERGWLGFENLRFDRAVALSPTAGVR